MKIKIYISTGELLDRISILEIKKEKILDQNKKSNILLELNHLNKKLNIINNSEEWIKKIKKINLKLWNVEDKIRKKERSQMFDSDFIKLARKVYTYNDLRYKIKKEINLYYNSFFKEEKSY